MTKVLDEETLAVFEKAIDNFDHILDSPLTPDEQFQLIDNVRRLKAALELARRWTGVDAADYSAMSSQFNVDMARIRELVGDE